MMMRRRRNRGENSKLKLKSLSPTLANKESDAIGGSPPPAMSLRDLDELEGALLLPLAARVAMTPLDHSKKTDNDPSPGVCTAATSSRTFDYRDLESYNQEQRYALQQQEDEEEDDDGRSERVSLLLYSTTDRDSERQFLLSLAKATRRGCQLAERDREIIERSTRNLCALHYHHEKRVETANAAAARRSFSNHQAFSNILAPNSLAGAAILLLWNSEKKSGSGSSTFARGEQTSLLAADIHSNDNDYDEEGGLGAVELRYERLVRMATIVGREKAEQERQAIMVSMRKTDAIQQGVQHMVRTQNYVLKQRTRQEQALRQQSVTV